ncbi:MAG: hypothetical protein ACMXYD_00330 [Candidatus Woesearchaeota archaeon]
MSKAIKLTLPDNLAQQLHEYAEELGYTNIQEITLEALREKTQKLHTIRELYRKKATKNISLLTPQEKQQLTLSAEENSKILREFNLN